MTIGPSHDRRLRPATAAAATLLAGAFYGWARLRHGKPIHTRGSVHTARLIRHGLTAAELPAWFTRPGEVYGVARLSRGLSVPRPLPDVLGLALRFPGPAGSPSDLLLSTTGLAPFARHLMLPRRDPARVPYTTLTPYRSEHGSVLFAALPAPAAHRAGAGGPLLRFTLASATPMSAWQPFGSVELTPPPAGLVDPPVAFDPVLHPLPGLWLPQPVARIRAASYRAARRGRAGRLDELEAVPAGSPDEA
ncbi:hypothetical protein ACFFWC_22415 [Plantactinospora siamensis]|uniref:Phosphodiesterase n=1 Tax=Plantactinospora siamensis TaxID=555372 RepID=A0ABV6NYG0_9ACTN